jgi:hypothetical protein
MMLESELSEHLVYPKYVTECKELLTFADGLDSKEIEIRIAVMAVKVVSRYSLSERDYCHLDILILANGDNLIALYPGNTILARGY